MTRLVLFLLVALSLFGADRQVYYSAVDTANSTTSTTWQTQTGITFTPDANKAYLIMGQIQYANGSSFVGAAQFRLNDGTTDFQSFELSGRNDGTNYWSNLMLAIYPSTGSPSSKTYNLQYRSSSGSTAAKIKNARIIAIRLESDDQYGETLGTAATSSSSWTDRVTVTNSASGTNDFICIGAAEFLHTSAGVSYGGGKMVLNGTDYSLGAVGDSGSIGYQGWSGVWQVSLANSNTAKTAYRSQNGNSVTIRNARMVILKSSNFPAVFFSGQQTRQTRANTAYADALSYAPTLNGTADYLVLGTIIRDYSNTSDIGYTQMRDAGSVLMEDYNRNSDSTNQLNSGAAMLRLTSVAAGSRTADWQHKSSASGTVGSDEMSLFYLQLTDVAGGGPTGPTSTMFLLGVGK